MMPTGWGFFPWPVLFVIPMVTMAVLMVIRLAHHDGPMGPRCGVTAPPARSAGEVAPPLVEDPMVVLRDRFARGEIDLAEFEARLERLLRTDPSESVPRWGRPATAASSGRTR